MFLGEVEKTYSSLYISKCCLILHLIASLFHCSFVSGQTFYICVQSFFCPSGRNFFFLPFYLFRAVVSYVIGRRPVIDAPVNLGPRWDSRSSRSRINESDLIPFRYFFFRPFDRRRSQAQRISKRYCAWIITQAHIGQLQKRKKKKVSRYLFFFLSFIPLWLCVFELISHAGSSRQQKQQSCASLYTMSSTSSWWMMMMSAAAKTNQPNASGITSRTCIIGRGESRHRFFGHSFSQTQ